MPTVLNRHHLKGAWPACALYIGRGTALGNPFIVGPDGDRDSVIVKFSTHLEALYAQGDPAVLTALAGIQESTALVCSCAPAPCHGMSVVQLWHRFMADGLPTWPRPQVYAGIGSRQTHPEMLGRMTRVARRLRDLGWTLRSGGAAGADEAFEAGAAGDAEIYLPSPGFRDRSSMYQAPTDAARAIASAVHPAWSRLSEFAMRLQARNSHQVLGADCRSPARFVLCWTPDAAERESERTRETGGTGQAIALASRWNVPVFNMARADALDRLAQSGLLVACAQDPT